MEDAFKRLISEAVERSGSIVMVTRLDGTVAYVNETFLRTTEYSRDEVIGIRPKELRADLDEDRSRIFQVVSAGQRWEGELRNRKKSGDVYWELASIGPIREQDGSIVGFLKVAHEITQHKQTEEALRDQLVRADRLATLGTLAAGVGHELNNTAMVLTSILPELSSAIQQGRSPDPTILADVDHVLTHVALHARQLLALGRPGPAHSERLDLSDVVRATLGMLRLLPRVKQIRFEGVLPETPVPVTVNRTRVEQVLVNLVVNAADATAQVLDRTPRVVVRVARSDDERARCEVSDNGCGIPPEKLETVFEPYFTTKPEGQGTGLGLPVVRQIVESYGGRLSARSNVGDGSTFIFDLPLAS